MDLTAAGAGPERPVCSAKGCRADPHWVVVWNNPKLHTPDREKRWLACGEHREGLASFLRVRGFLRRVDPFTEPAGHSPSGAT